MSDSYCCITAKKLRFFFHYNKKEKMMTVHFKGRCHIVKDILCECETSTKWKNGQPNLVMQGWANSLNIVDRTAIIR